MQVTIGQTVENGSLTAALVRCFGQKQAHEQIQLWDRLVVLCAQMNEGWEHGEDRLLAAVHKLVAPAGDACRIANSPLPLCLELS